MANMHDQKMHCNSKSDTDQGWRNKTIHSKYLSPGKQLNLMVLLFTTKQCNKYTSFGKSLCLLLILLGVASPEPKLTLSWLCQLPVCNMLQHTCVQTGWAGKDRGGPRGLEGEVYKPRISQFALSCLTEILQSTFSHVAPFRFCMQEGSVPARW